MVEGSVGQYKVAWLDGDLLKSKMFDSLEQAKSFVQNTAKSLLMRSISISNGMYSWELIAFGSTYNKFKAYNFVNKNPVMFGFLFIVLIIFALYGFLSTINNK